MANKTRKQWIYENVISLGSALIIVFAIRSSVIEAFKIPSGSMIPTLLVGDHIFVNKFAYGFKFPFTDWFMDEPIILVKAEGPKRGDIVVFKYPKDESIYYIKRVIGEPGDTIEVRNKLLYINGKMIQRVPVSTEKSKELIQEIGESKYENAQLEVFYEELNDKKPTVMIDKDSFMTENFAQIKVPENQYFVMGDNRDYSNDSRFWGFVPAHNIKGKAMVIWLSLWFDFSSGDFTFKPQRIGTILK